MNFELVFISSHSHPRRYRSSRRHSCSKSFLIVHLTLALVSSFGEESFILLKSSLSFLVVILSVPIITVTPVAVQVVFVTLPVSLRRPVVPGSWCDRPRQVLPPRRSTCLVGECSLPPPCAACLFFSPVSPPASAPCLNPLPHILLPQISCYISLPQPLLLIPCFILSPCLNPALSLPFSPVSPFPHPLSSSSALLYLPCLMLPQSSLLSPLSPASRLSSVLSL